MFAIAPILFNAKTAITHSGVLGIISVTTSSSFTPIEENALATFSISLKKLANVILLSK